MHALDSLTAEEINTLFSSYHLTDSLTLKNRIVMAPMTRNMANDDFSPTDAMCDYYTRRTDAGFIVTEGTIISADARGFTHTPGIFTSKQIECWKKITDSVHQKDGIIFLQLWHVGRVSHPDFRDGERPISASETVMHGRLSRSDLTFGQSKAATLDEINSIIGCFQTAATNAMLAGFDGIEIHGANGYLIDQFLHFDTNHRTDEFGLTPENMSRFPLAVINACGKAIGYEKIGIRLSPGAYLNQIKGDMRDADVFSYLLSQLNTQAIAYVHTGNFDDSSTFKELHNLTMTAFIRSHYHGTIIASGNYNLKKAATCISKNEFDLVSIGKPFIANPDLIQKLRDGNSLISYDNEMLKKLF